MPTLIIGRVSLPLDLLVWIVIVWIAILLSFLDMFHLWRTQRSVSPVPVATVPVAQPVEQLPAPYAAWLEGLDEVLEAL